MTGAPFYEVEHSRFTIIDAGRRTDPREFGVGLAQRMVKQVHHGMTAEEATSCSATEVTFRANAMVAENILSREEAREWVQQVKAAFAERLDELRIFISEE